MNNDMATFAIIAGILLMLSSAIDILDWHWSLRENIDRLVGDFEAEIEVTLNSDSD